MGDTIVVYIFLQRFCLQIQSFDYDIRLRFQLNSVCRELKSEYLLSIVTIAWIFKREVISTTVYLFIHFFVIVVNETGQAAAVPNCTSTNHQHQGIF